MTLEKLRSWLAGDAKAAWRQERFQHPRFGVFRPDRQEVSKFVGQKSVWRNWVTKYEVPGQGEVLISLSGNEEGPWQGLLEASAMVIDHLDAIESHANTALAQRNIPATFADFRLTCISDWNEPDDILQLEFVPLGEPKLDDSLEFYWPGDDCLMNHHLVFRKLCSYSR